MYSLFDPEGAQTLLQRFHRLTPDHSRHWGTMSANQMICHLSDQLRVALGEIPSQQRKNIFWRTFIKWMVLYVPLTYPKGAPTTPEMKTTTASQWEADKAEFLRLFEAFRQRGPAGQWSPHPAFGRLTGTEWGILAARHMNHHLRQFGE